MTTSVNSILDSSQITSLIQQAETAYAAPVVALQAQEQPIEAQISDLGKVQGALSSLQTALASLSDLSSLAQRVVTASPPGIVSATATNTATPGLYDLTGIELAQAQSLVSPSFASATATLGSGSIAIKISGSSAAALSIASGQSSLQGIASAINQANTGVDATVLYNGSSYHLVLTGDNPGTANAFAVSGTGALSSLSYHTGASGAGYFSLGQTAANASLSVNGFAITSGSNTISGALPGLTLTLAASGSATVQVTASTSGLSQAASGVVSAINGVLGTISQYASYNATSGAGPLFGNVGLAILKDSLIDAIQSPAVSGAAADSAYSSLAAAGFGITSGGTVTLNNASFQSAAQSDYGAVSSLVQGLYGTLSSVVTAALSSGSGGVVGNINSLNATITSMNKQVAILQQQAQAETLALTQQYDNAEATLSQLQTVSDFLTTYFNQTSGASGG
jgi:flagellar hook-associated protein 2